MKRILLALLLLVSPALADNKKDFSLQVYPDGFLTTEKKVHVFCQEFNWITNNSTLECRILYCVSQSHMDYYTGGPATLFCWKREAK